MTRPLQGSVLIRRPDPEDSSWIIGYDVLNFDVEAMRAPSDEEMTSFFGLSREDLVAKTRLYTGIGGIPRSGFATAVMICCK